MSLLQKAYDYIINNKELMKKVKFIDIKFFVAPKLGNDIKIEDINVKYDDDIISYYYNFGTMIDNIVEYTGGYDNYLESYDSRDELGYKNFYDIDGQEILIRYRLLDKFFDGNFEKSLYAEQHGKEVEWENIYIDINGEKFDDIYSAFEYLNTLLVNGKLDINHLQYN